jgi:hypothetical protein
MYLPKQHSRLPGHCYLEHGDSTCARLGSAGGWDWVRRNGIPEIGSRNRNPARNPRVQKAVLVVEPSGLQSSGEIEKSTDEKDRCR